MSKHKKYYLGNTIFYEQYEYGNRLTTLKEKSQSLDETRLNLIQESENIQNELPSVAEKQTLVSIRKDTALQNVTLRREECKRLEEICDLQEQKLQSLKSQIIKINEMLEEYNKNENQQMNVDIAGKALEDEIASLNIEN